MFDFLTHLFDSTGFPARWYCGDWTPGLGWLHILSDLAIWSAYFTIPFVLVSFVIRRRDVPFRGIFWLFGVFILACGTTHLMEAIIFWHPVYRLAGLIKLLTAVASWATVVALVPVVPKALAMRTPQELEREIAGRKQAEDALNRANAELEMGVQRRTGELAEANASLRHEREMLKITLESIGDAVMVADIEGRVTFLNPIAQRLTGWNEEEAKGQPLQTVFRIMNEKTRKTVENPALRALKEGSVVGLANHTILIARDGTERAIDDSAAPIRHENGEVAGVVLVFRDVTEHRKAERSARFLASIVASSDDAIVGKDISGIITSWNQGAERLFGYTAPEAIGRPIAILAPPDRADEMPAILARIRKGERIEHFDTVHRTKDGRLVPISLTVSPIKDDEGEIIGASKIARDVSERKLAEEALRNEKERLQATLTGIGDAVIVTDADSRITIMNPVACALTGWGEEATGRPLGDVFRIKNEQTGQAVESPVNRVIREGTIVGLANHTVLVSKDGAERPIDDSAAPIRDQGGRVVGVVMVFRDVAARRQIEAERERLREQLAAKVQELEALFDIVPVQIWLGDADCQRFFGNRRAYEDHGFEYGINASFDAPIPELPAGLRVVAGGRDLQPEEMPMQLAARKGKPVRDFEHEVVHADGRRVTMLANVTPLLDPSGTVRGVVGCYIDISERKRVEAALRASEAQFRQLADAMPQIVWTARPNGYIDYFNERWYEYTGFPRGEYGQESWEPILHPDDVGRCVDTYFRCVKAGEPYQIEHRFKDRNTGGHRWFLGRALPVRDEQGRVVRWFGTCTDIDDTKKAGERLRLLWEAAAVLLSSAEPDAMLRELFASIGPHLALDMYFNYMVNETGDGLKLVSFLGIPADAAQELRRLEFGQAISGAVAQSRQPVVATQIQESDDPRAKLVRSLGVRAYACNPLQVNNELLGTLSFASRSRDQFAEVELDFLRTICQYVAVAYERLRFIRQLQEADRRKDEFLATLAHELRNPLAPIRNAVDLLGRFQEDASLIERATSIIGRQVGHMVRLIDDLLDMSRISQGKVQVRKERVELAELIRSAVETARPLIDAQAHELTVTLPPEAIWLRADPIRLAQVIANLLNNAAKYTAKGGHIWLTALRQGTEAVVSVRDTGIGIAAEHLSHIFEMFSQVAPALKRSQGGLGIGLSLVRGLIELHGGTVEARSDGLGLGSEFKVRLPIVEAPAAPESAEPAEETEPASSGKRFVLAVDDNRDGADSLAMMLRMMGHDARTAYDGLEAIQAAATFRPEVILLDIGLPKLNGYEAARHIRQQRWGKDMALIALSGWGQEEDRRRALEAGFDHHLTKPVEAAALEKLLAVINPVTRG
jgi:PAS domain S-box-containing protein